MEDLLTAAQVQEKLDTDWLGQPYTYHPTVTSTNDLLKAQAASGDLALSAHGAVLLSEYQECGRGRLSRGWHAPRGSSLLFSVLLRPAWPAERLGWLTMIAGLAVSEAVELTSSVPVHLKWPNDGVLAQEKIWRKYCGILLEGQLANDDLLNYAVIGIGVNVNIPGDQLPPADFPATSLMIANGRALPRLDLFIAILARLEYHYERADEGLSPHAAWQDRLIFMNDQVIVHRLSQDDVVEGTAVGTDPTGRLLIRDDSGRIRRLAAGDVSLRKPQNG